MVNSLCESLTITGINMAKPCPPLQLVLSAIIDLFLTDLTSTNYNPKKKWLPLALFSRHSYSCPCYVCVQLSDKFPLKEAALPMPTQGAWGATCPA